MAATESTVKQEIAREAFLPKAEVTVQAAQHRRQLFKRHNTVDSNRGKYTIHNLLKGAPQMPVCRVGAAHEVFQGDLGPVKVFICVKKALHPYAPGMKVGVVGDHGDKTGAIFISPGEALAAPFALFTRPNSAGGHAWWQYVGHYTLQREFHAGECGIPAALHDDDCSERRVTFSEIFKDNRACGQQWVEALIKHQNWGASLKWVVRDACWWAVEHLSTGYEVDCCSLASKCIDYSELEPHKCRRVPAIKKVLAMPAVKTVLSKHSRGLKKAMMAYHDAVGDEQVMHEQVMHNMIEPLATKIFNMLGRAELRALTTEFLESGALDCGYSVIEYVGYDKKLYEALCRNQQDAPWQQQQPSPDTAVLPIKFEQVQASRKRATSTGNHHDAAAPSVNKPKRQTTARQKSHFRLSDLVWVNCGHNYGQWPGWITGECDKDGRYRVQFCGPEEEYNDFQPEKLMIFKPPAIEEVRLSIAGKDRGRWELAVASASREWHRMNQIEDKEMVDKRLAAYKMQSLLLCNALAASLATIQGRLVALLQ